MRTAFEFALERRGYPFRRATADLESISSLRDEALAQWQMTRRWEIVRHHASRNQLYKSLLAGPLPKTWEQLPIVTKGMFQRPLASCLSEGSLSGAVHRSSTSGSSGEPFAFARDKYTHARSWALTAQRYGWHGILLSSRQARFYGIPLEFTPRLVEVCKDHLMRRVRFPVFDLSDVTLERYRKRIERGRFGYLYGYTNSLLDFARYLIRSGGNLKAECPTLVACIVTSEMCEPADKKVIETAFGVPVVNEYGASETGVIAFEDSGGDWRLSWENLFVEVVDEGGHPVPDGNTGDILVTDLFNQAMPFVRYRIGDTGMIRARVQSEHKRPSLATLEGRINDTIVLPSGRRAAGLTFYYVARSLLAQSGSLREFVIRQKAIDEFVFEVVSDAPMTDRDVRTIEGKLEEYLEPGLTLRINQVASISRPSSGKRKHFYSELPPQGELSSIDRGGSHKN